VPVNFEEKRLAVKLETSALAEDLSAKTTALSFFRRDQR
jgi:hypothetical protein